MDTINAKKIEELLKAGKENEAKKYLADFLDKASDSNTEGEALLDYSMIYMSVMNVIDDAYKTQLDGILAELKELDKSEKGMDDKINLAQVRADLH